jgi:hypothetical protein
MDRSFDAIVVGEYERAFYGNQFTLMAPLFDHYGVQLWMPEAGGAVDFVSDAHEQLMIGLGIQSKREITRTRIRVTRAMATQVRVLLRCGMCGRRMESCWVYNRAAYRCRRHLGGSLKIDGRSAMPGSSRARTNGVTEGGYAPFPQILSFCPKHCRAADHLIL